MKEAVILEIEEMLLNMNSHLKVLPKTVNSKHRTRDIIRGLKWLKEYRAMYFRPILLAYKMCPPELWNNYLLHGVTGLAEQKILAEKITRARIAWRKRPIAFRKVKKSGQKKSAKVTA